MSASDVSYACGCYSFASDCRSPGGGGFCPTHLEQYEALDNIPDARERSDAYVALWQRIGRENKGDPKNWGAAE